MFAEPSLLQPKPPANDDPKVFKTSTSSFVTVQNEQLLLYKDTLKILQALFYCYTESPHTHTHTPPSAKTIS